MDDEIREDVEAPVSEPAEKAKTNAALRTFAQQSFLSKALFFVSAECIYEYYITFSFVGLMLRALQVLAMHRIHLMKAEERRRKASAALPILISSTVIILLLQLFYHPSTPLFIIFIGPPRPGSWYHKLIVDLLIAFGQALYFHEVGALPF